MKGELTRLSEGCSPSFPVYLTFVLLWGVPRPMHVPVWTKAQNVFGDGKGREILF